MLENFSPLTMRWHDNQNLSVRGVEQDGVALSVSVHQPVAQIIRTRHVDLSANGHLFLPVTIRYI